MVSRDTRSAATYHIGFIARSQLTLLSLSQRCRATARPSDSTPTSTKRIIALS